eukprot:TRINITY_DN7795_c0_g2_i1.p1 TRINITY_DN7795_c0_g2~~TRINITY_DN7795_c0_g2_i1.p1  ORF type:complete len:232 (-),score=3.75 TRINITY_DN7795_c0_g2_i1:162-803(-)
MFSIFDRKDKRVAQSEYRSSFAKRQSSLRHYTSWKGRKGRTLGLEVSQNKCKNLEKQKKTMFATKMVSKETFKKVLKQRERAIRSLRQRIQDFKNNPITRSGTEHLPSEKLKQINEARIRHLQKKIANWEEEIKKIQRGECDHIYLNNLNSNLNLNNQVLAFCVGLFKSGEKPPPRLKVSQDLLEILQIKYWKNEIRDFDENINYNKSSRGIL